MKSILSLVSVLFIFAVQAKDVHYDLTIDYKMVNFSGKNIKAMAINNTIPGPVLEFNEGDVAVINVRNLTNDEASIHWHGLLLPQDQDGVPYLTYFPINAGSTFEYRFPLKHAGTYWYHSHTKIDEQKGQYGAIIVHPKHKRVKKFDHQVVVQLSDWTDEDPYDVLKNLKKDGDWYAYKKNSVISLKGYFDNSDFDAWLTNRWQRMEGMDVSDVGYDAFLANGKKSLSLLPEASAGDRVLVRIINSGASTYFDVQQTGDFFTVVAADGPAVQPIKVEEFRIGMAETYDVIVTIPESGGYEFSANSIDGTGGVKINLGSGLATPSPDPVKPNLFIKMDHGASHSMHDMSSSDKAATDHSMHDMSSSDKDATDHSKHDMSSSDKDATDHSKHKMTVNDKQNIDHSLHKIYASNTTEQESVIYNKLNYTMLKSPEPIEYSGQLQEFTLRLTGDMESYNWSFNDLPLSQADVIKIDKGKVVRFHFKNESMMHHPLHLHGHFFKVISGNGAYDVLKHTVDVPPMGSVTIEFAANEEKDWFFHCHNLYHAKTGMARVVRYSDYAGNPEFVKAKMNSDEIMDSDWYYRADINLFSSHAEASYRLSNTDYIIEFSAENNFGTEREVELNYDKKVTRWLRYFVGVEHTEDGNEASIGIKYVLPFSIDSALWINSEGNVHVEVSTEFQLTESFNLELGASTEKEWEATLEYRTSPYWAIGLNANEISKIGLGVSFTF